MFALTLSFVRIENLPHIGIVTNRKSADGKRFLLVHNVDRGQVLEDCLFSYIIKGIFSKENNYGLMSCLISSKFNPP
ncbi:DUF1287 domain-containing protein [Flavobacterium sp. 3HN19-14]|uniref:DUF1287 domain-containing protein n=1 Tax=Flavobacterium sp. 3HN19-14 TaxID=3448133 RepID=UPI003EDF9A5C